MGQVLDGSERILVVPASWLAALGRSPGYHPWPEEDSSATLDALLREAAFLPRTADLEHGPGGLDWLQVIPYGVLLAGTTAPARIDAGRVFAYRRPARGGDRRLTGLCSIGIGGHANPVGGVADGAGIVLANLARELREAMGAVCPAPRPAGLLWDASNAIGRRHLGLVYVCPVDPTQVQPRAAEAEPLGWFTPRELREAHPAALWEGWSARAIGVLDRILAPAPERSEAERRAM